MVRALASHQCVPGSIPAGCHMWVEFVIGSRSCSEDFSPILRYSSPYKNQHFKFQFNLEVMDEEPNRGICPCNFLFIVIYLFTLLLLLLLLFFFYKTPSSMHQCSKPSAFVTQKKKTLVVECFIM